MIGGGVSEYAALNARIRVMYSNLLTPQQLDKLCEAEDITAFIRLLKETTYNTYLTGLDEKELTPRQIAYRVKSRIIDVYKVVVQLSPTHTRPLASQLFRRFEIENLKAVLRSIVTGANWDRVKFVLYPSASPGSLPLQEMVEANSVEAAVEQLRNTIYYDTLIHAMSRYNTEQSLFPLEVALDLSFWRKLWNDVNQLGSQDRAQSLRVIGLLLDLNNLMWAIRYRVFHNLSEEEIINYTLPFGYRVRDQDIRAIAAGVDISHVVERIYPNLTGITDIFKDPQSRLSELELMLQRNIAQRCRSAFVGYPFHIGLPLAFLILYELEIQDLIALIEAKWLHKPFLEFHSYLLVGCPPE